MWGQKGEKGGSSYESPAAWAERGTSTPHEELPAAALGSRAWRGQPPAAAPVRVRAGVRGRASSARQRGQQVPETARGRPSHAAGKPSVRVSVKCIHQEDVFVGACRVREVKVAQLYPTICDPMDYTVRGILQARTLEWVAYPFSRRSSQPRNQTRVSCIAGRFFTS